MYSRTSSSTVVVLLGAGSLAAQSASSKSYFLVGGEQASGGTCQTPKYALTAAVGSGVVAARSTSSRYTLVGGFTAMLETKTTGRPWLTGVRPRFATMRGAAALTVHGTELNLGPTPAITIGGRPATLLSRQNHALGTKLPAQILGKQYWSEVPGILYIDVPPAETDPLMTVIALQLKGEIDLYRK